MEDRNNKLKTGLGQFLRNACDLMILQFLWIACSLPIVTIGPATSALFSVTLKIAREEPVETAREFFEAFKSNFKQAFVLGLIALFGAVVAYSDVIYALSLEGSMRKVFFVLSGVVIGVWLIFTSYTFPLQARYENTLKMHIRNAFIAAFSAPGKTLVMWIVYAFPVVLIIFLTKFVIYIGWAFLLFGVSLPVFINSKTLRDIFDKLVGGQSNDKE